MSSVQLFVNAWLSVLLSEEGSSFDNFLQTTFQRKKNGIKACQTDILLLQSNMIS